MKKQKKPVFVYMVTRQDEESIYIGSTINPVSRLKQHNSIGTQKGDSLLSKNASMQILFETNEKHRIHFESYYAEVLKNQGFTLKNKAQIGNFLIKESLKPCGFQLPESTIILLEEYAKRIGISKQVVVNEAIINHVKNETK